MPTSSNWQLFPSVDPVDRELIRRVTGLEGDRLEIQCRVVRYWQDKSQSAPRTRGRGRPAGTSTKTMMRYKRGSACDKGYR